MRSWQKIVEKLSRIDVCSHYTEITGLCCNTPLFLTVFDGVLTLTENLDPSALANRLMAQPLTKNIVRSVVANEQL